MRFYRGSVCHRFKSAVGIWYVTDDRKILLAGHPEAKECWKAYVEAEEEMQNPDMPKDRPFQKIIDGEGNCVGIAIIHFNPKKLLSKPQVSIFDLEIWDESRYSKEMLKDAIMRRHPQAERITIGSGHRKVNI